MFKLLLPLSCLLATAAAYVSPVTFWPMYIFSLIFPFLYMSNLIVVIVFILISRWKNISAGGLAIGLVILSLVLTTRHAFNYFSTGAWFAPAAKEATFQKSKLKVLTHNTQNFNLYDWRDNLTHQKRFLDLYRMKNPDVLCLQEFFTKNKGALDNISAVKRLGYLHYYFNMTTQNGEGENQWGQALFSKYPLLEVKPLSFQSKMKTQNGAFYADIEFKGELKGKKIRVIVAHLESAHLRAKAFTPIGDNAIVNPMEEETIGIIKKLKRSAIRRAQQVNEIDDVVRHSPHPVVVCGDFNDLPGSYVYTTLANSLLDSFLEMGSGVGSTYNGAIPFLRLDYILHSKTLRGESYERIKEAYSDHHAVMVSFQP